MLESTVGLLDVRLCRTNMEFFPLLKVLQTTKSEVYSEKEFVSISQMTLVKDLS